MTQYYKKIILFIALIMLTACTQPSQKTDDPKVADTAKIEIVKPETENTIEPIKNSLKRVTKKPFGIKITPSTSPVQPEKFSGYHTGTDFEIFPEEKQDKVTVFAICSGEVISKNWVNGYGGVLIQKCNTKEGEPVTVLYGHLKIDSLQNSVGDILDPSSPIGLLGTGYSTETDKERKHLHLSVHKSSVIEYKGYVQSEEELKEWIDPIEFIKP